MIHNDPALLLSIPVHGVLESPKFTTLIELEAVCQSMPVLLSRSNYTECIADNVAEQFTAHGKMQAVRGLWPFDNLKILRICRIGL